MQRAHRASIEFSVIWQSEVARHKDRYFINKVDFWRDFFPGNMEQKISALKEGESHSAHFGAGVLVTPYDQDKIIKIREADFERNQNGNTIHPLSGRFYPQGFAWKALPCTRASVTPFRLLGLENGLMVVDTNHPLSRYPLSLEATYIKKRPAIEEHGGTCNHIVEMITNHGPGMQIPFPDAETDFYTSYPFKRNNEDNDALFYTNPRLTAHIDKMAQRQIQSIYARVLSSGSKILDLMSSWVSHIPDSVQDYHACGLGMNEEELRANQQLSDYVVHDLNLNPVLPFDDDTFDAVLCTVSIEYLTHPIEVISEVARVIKPGGIFVTTISDRWFPGKEILPWPEMHPFERLGFVLDLYMKAKVITNLHTESVRGLPRPSDDAHTRERKTADPIFAVWGTVSG